MPCGDGRHGGLLSGNPGQPGPPVPPQCWGPGAAAEAPARPRQVRPVEWWGAWSGVWPQQLRQHEGVGGPPKPHTLGKGGSGSRALAPDRRSGVPGGLPNAAPPLGPTGPVAAKVAPAVASGPGRQAATAQVPRQPWPAPPLLVIARTPHPLGPGCICPRRVTQGMPVNLVDAQHGAQATPGHHPEEQAGKEGLGSSGRRRHAGGQARRTADQRKP